MQTQLFLFNSYRYEDEINKRTAAENEFVTLKKVKAMWLVGADFWLLWRKSLYSIAMEPPSSNREKKKKKKKKLGAS